MPVPILSSLARRVVSLLLVGVKDAGMSQWSAWAALSLMAFRSRADFLPGVMFSMRCRMMGALAALNTGPSSGWVDLRLSITMSVTSLAVRALASMGVKSYWGRCGMVLMSWVKVPSSCMVHSVQPRPSVQVLSAKPRRMMDPL